MFDKIYIATKEVKFLALHPSSVNSFSLPIVCLLKLVNFIHPGLQEDFISNSFFDPTLSFSQCNVLANAASCQLNWF